MPATRNSPILLNQRIARVRIEIAAQDDLYAVEGFLKEHPFTKAEYFTRALGIDGCGSRIPLQLTEHMSGNSILNEVSPAGRNYRFEVIKAGDRRRIGRKRQNETRLTFAAYSFEVGDSFGFG